MAGGLPSWTSKEALSSTLQETEFGCLIAPMPLPEEVETLLLLSL